MLMSSSRRLLITRETENPRKDIDFFLFRKRFLCFLSRSAIKKLVGWSLRAQRGGRVCGFRCWGQTFEDSQNFNITRAGKSSQQYCKVVCNDHKSTAMHVTLVDSSDHIMTGDTFRSFPTGQTQSFDVSSPWDSTYTVSKRLVPVALAINRCLRNKSKPLIVAWFSIIVIWYFLLLYELPK